MTSWFEFQHPAQVGMTYLEHLRFSLGLAWSLGLATGASVVHAIWPDILQTYTSRTIARLHEKIQQTRHAN